MFHAIKWEKVTKLEPMRVFEPLFVILLAFIIYSVERQVSWKILIAALIASIALILSHIRKHHFTLNKYMFAALGGSFLFALELVVSRSILDYYNPMTFYFVRCSLIFLVALFVFKRSTKGFTKSNWIYMAVTAMIWAFVRSLIYFGYTTFGVIFTTLLFILAPVFLYLFARIFLKEKLSWRNILATVVIVCCVAYAIVVG